MARTATSPVMATKPILEGRRLTHALFWLETETLVVNTPECSAAA